MNIRKNKQNSDNSEYVLSQGSIYENMSRLGTPIKGFEKKYEITSKKLGKKNHGNWKKDQEKRFMDYMLKHQEIYRDKDLRRTHKIFKKMGKYVKSRSSEQCRSHHQKLELKLKSFDGIIKFIQDKIKDPVIEDQSDDGIHYSPIRIQDYLPQLCYQNDQINLRNTKKELKVEKACIYKEQKNDVKNNKISTSVSNPKVQRQRCEGTLELIQIGNLNFEIKLGADFFNFEEQYAQM